ncbi:hypothetical protein MUK72_17135 (plasmid) [Halococcus dombrowskii]|uniref:Transposase n=1 Tax=Halococcus dombrowskii TaxID=179637 RepID=A0AAX3AUB7_HALDO|nr:hypothetical protein [Halococcus dombrowskii]UOO96935.1 hypothetical protein MUK72_17135 [Halococcus dombrowskii]
MTEEHRVVAALAEQADDLCHIHDHATRVIKHLDIPTDTFSDYEQSGDADFPIKGIVKLFLYKELNAFSQAETARRLRGVASVYTRFNLPRPITQASISHNWRNRLVASENRSEPSGQSLKRSRS